MISSCLVYGPTAENVVGTAEQSRHCTKRGFSETLEMTNFAC